MPGNLNGALKVGRDAVGHWVAWVKAKQDFFKIQESVTVVILHCVIEPEFIENSRVIHIPPIFDGIRDAVAIGVIAVKIGCQIPASQPGVKVADSIAVQISCGVIWIVFVEAETAPVVPILNMVRQSITIRILVEANHKEIRALLIGIGFLRQRIGVKNKGFLIIRETVPIRVSLPRIGEMNINLIVIGKAVHV